MSTVMYQCLSCGGYYSPGSWHPCAPLTTYPQELYDWYTPKVSPLPVKTIEQQILEELREIRKLLTPRRDVIDLRGHYQRETGSEPESNSKWPPI